MVDEQVVKRVAAQGHDPGVRRERTLRFAGHHPNDGVADRAQRVCDAGGQVEAGLGLLGDLEFIEPVVERGPCGRVQHQALDGAQAHGLFGELDVGQQAGRAVQAAGDLGLHLHQQRLGAELADALQLGRVHRVFVHQARHVEVAHLALLGRALEAGGAALADGDQLEHAGALLDRQGRGANRVGVKDVQVAQADRLEGVALNCVGQGQRLEGVSVEDVEDVSHLGAPRGLRISAGRWSAL